MSVSSGIFGDVLGNLPLVNLAPRAISKLSPDSRMEFRRQLNHHCLRRAWLDATLTKTPIRKMLDLRSAQAEAKLSSIVHGHTPNEYGLQMAMADARHENEWLACFGFFLKGEIEHLTEHRSPGPLLRTRLSSGQAPPTATFVYADALRGFLKEYRSYVRDNSLARETVDIVRRITGMHDCLTSVPVEVKCYFLLADVLTEQMAGLESAPLPQVQQTLAQVEAALAALKEAGFYDGKDAVKSDGAASSYKGWKLKAPSASNE